MKKTLLSAICASLLASCSVTESLKTSQRRINRQAETNAMNTKVVNKPILADLEVGSKRETTSYKTTNKDIAGSILMSGGSEGKKGGFLMSASEGMKNEAKNRAQFKFMEDFKCDYLVDPIYKIETESTSGSTTIYISVEVSAYPAFYKKFSQPDSLPKSVFELGRLDSREIPLMTHASSANKTKTEAKMESGFLFGPSLNNIKKDENGNEFEYNKAGVGGSLGFYTLFPIAGKFGFRSEYMVSTRAYSYDIGKYFDDLFGQPSGTEGTINNRFYGVDVPLMLNFEAADNFHLHTGFSLNYTAIGRYKEDYTFEDFDGFGNPITVQADESGKIDGFDGSLQVGFILGGYFQTEGSFGAGLRQQFGMGEDRWSTTQLVLGFRF